MKKAVFLLILVLGIVTGVFCQTPGSANQSGPMDLVVVLDTSASMSNYYQGTSDYLIGPFLKEFLRIGDTFHLISFAETPKVEISRLIEGVGDVEAVIGRLLLMYPLAAQSDVAGAMNYAEKYSSSLPGSRHKKIILITDGDAPGTQTLVTTASAVLKSQGADLQYIKVPVTGTGPSSGRPAGTAPVKTAPAAQTAQSTPKTQTSQPGTTVQTTQPPTSQPAQSTGSAAAPSRPAAQPVQPPAQVQSQPPQTTQAPRPTTQAVPPSQGGTSAVLPPPQTSQGIAPPTSQGTVPGTGYSTVTPSTVIPSTVIPPPSTPQTVPPSTVTGLASGETQQPPVTAAGGIPQTTAPETGTNQPYQGQSAESPAPQYPAQPVQPQVQVPVQTAPQPSPDSGTGYSGDIPLPLIIGLAILALLLLGLLILFAARRLHSSPNRVMAQAAAPMDNRDRLEAERQERIKGAEMMGSYAESQRNKPKPMPKDKVYTAPPPETREGPLMLNLFVEDQNTAIGRRNIHAVKPGYTFSVGGGKSDFLIFLVPIEPHIADVQYDGSNCTFYPRKPEYFPDIGSQPVPNCIGKSIRVLSKKRYELHIRMEMYEDPLKALNKMLHSIEMPDR